MKTAEQVICEQATGCLGVGDYRPWAEKHGYTELEVVDWGGTAGDWTFIVSQGDNVWYLMHQENNYPQPGFRRWIDTVCLFMGTAEEVLSKLSCFN